MGRLGWAIAIVVFIGIPAYLLWPSAASDASTSERLWEGSLPVDFVLTSPDSETIVGPLTLRRQGIERPVDRNRRQSLQTALAGVRSDRVKREVPMADLRAYGLSPEADGFAGRLSAGPFDLRWGTAGDQPYVWTAEGGLLLAVTTTSLNRIVRSAERLDGLALIEGAIAEDELVIDGRRYYRDVVADDTWREDGRPERPPMDGRIRAVAASLAQIPFSRWEAMAEPLEPLHQLRWGSDDGQAVELLGAADGQWWARAEGLPPQPLDPGRQGALMSRLAALEQDSLADRPLDRAAVTTVRVLRDGAAWFELAASPALGRAERGPWSVRWSGGREDARGDALGQVFQAFDGLVVSRPLQIEGLVQAPNGPGSFSILLEDDAGTVLRRLDWTGATAASGGFLGTLDVVPDLIEHISPASFLDPRLLPVDPARISKFQRVRFGDGGPQPEVYRQSGGDWQRVLPDPAPVDAAAMGALLAALTSAQAQSVHLPDAPDGPQGQPALSLAVRIGGSDGLAIDEEPDLRDTLTRDWGLDVFVSAQAESDPDGSGPGWWARPMDRTRLVRLQPAVVEALFAPVLRLPVLPVVPSSVLRIELAGGERPFALRGDREGTWFLERNGERSPADGTEVRRFLRQLAAVEAERREEGAAPVAGDEVVHQTTVVVPDHAGRERRLTVRIGAADSAGLVAVTVADQVSGEAERLGPRLILSAEAAQALVAPDRRFIVVGGP